MLATELGLRRHIIPTITAGMVKVAFSIFPVYNSLHLYIRILALKCTP